MAENLYQSMKGNTARVNAWMDFIEGKAYPPDIEFLTTLRTGEIFNTSIYMFMTGKDADPEASPLAIANPELEDLSYKLLGEYPFNSIKLSLRQKNSDIMLQKTVGELLTMFSITPIEVVNLNQDQLIEKIRYALIYHCLYNSNILSLGEIRDFSTAEELLNSWEITFITDPEKYNHISEYEVLSKIDKIKRLINATRIEGKLNTGQLETVQALNQETAVEINWSKTVDITSQRFDFLINLKLKPLQDFLQTLTVQSIINNTFTDEMIKSNLEALASIGFPEALSLLLLTRTSMESPSLNSKYLMPLQIYAENQLKEMRGKLASRIENLEEQLRECQAMEDSEPKVISYNQLISIAIGNPQAYIITPCVNQTLHWNVHLERVVQHCDPYIYFDRLDYSHVKSSIDDLIKLSSENSENSNYQFYTFQGENINEVYFSENPSVSHIPSIACLLIDQWSEFIPNAEETTGIAIHYPAPKIQAPNAVLIAVPSTLNTSRWSVEELGQTIASTLSLLRMRMVNSEQVQQNSDLSPYLPLSIIGLMKEEGKIFEVKKRPLAEALNNTHPYSYSAGEKDSPDNVAERN